MEQGKCCSYIIVQFLFSQFTAKCLNGYFLQHVFIFSENDLILPKQSGFRPGDSCTNQLLSIAHEIFSAFDDGHEVKGVFLNISKAFDRPWHEDLIFKLQQNGISRDLIIWIKNVWAVENRVLFEMVNIHHEQMSKFAYFKGQFLVLSKINGYALQWKMSFNPDPTK